MPVTEVQRRTLTERRERIRAQQLRPAPQRPASSARGIHHAALICADVARTIDFYQGLLGFPLTGMSENRDLPGSTRFLFDVGHGNTLAFFDLPGVDVGPYAEVFGGLHHLAISMEPQRWQQVRDRLDAHGVEYLARGQMSIYLKDPDGGRVELTGGPLGEVHGPGAN